MAISISNAISGFKYAYLIMFFALLAGFFHPLISGASPDNMIVGVLILFVGLGGGILVYKSTSSQKRRGMFLGIGFGLIAISFYMILLMTGRF